MSDDADAVVQLPIEETLDLHTFSPREVTAVVEEYLHAAHHLGLREVRLIHGRGTGIQRARVHSLVSRLPFVVQAYDAPPDRGGWGATVVVLADSESSTGG